jgi:hypothetical protein
MYARACALQAIDGGKIYVIAPSFLCFARASDAAGPGEIRLGCASLLLDVPAPPPAPSCALPERAMRLAWV